LIVAEMSETKKLALVAAASVAIGSAATLLIGRFLRSRRCNQEKKCSSLTGNIGRPYGNRVSNGIVTRVSRFIDEAGVERLGQLLENDLTTAQLVEGPLLGQQFLLGSLSLIFIHSPQPTIFTHFY
jgi:hypothetical protein